MGLFFPFENSRRSVAISKKEVKYWMFLLSFFFLPLHIDLSTVVVFVVVEISLLGMEMIMVA